MSERFIRVKRPTVVFRLEITLGNAAMESNDDVARALKKLAVSVTNGGEGKIRDTNGNTVGEWGFHEETD